MRHPRLLALVLAVPALGLAACTQTEEDSTGDFRGEQQAVAQAIEDLQSAGSDRDANRICESLLARDLVGRIERTSRRPCADALGDALDDVDSFALDVKRVQVEGARATATVTSDAGDQDRTDTFVLVRDGRNWKLASLPPAGR